MIRAALVIAGREIREAWSLPRCHLAAAAVLALAGAWFLALAWPYSSQSVAAAALAASNPDLAEALNVDVAVIAPYLRGLVVLLFVVAPLETMRTIAGERSAATIELLLAAPIPLSAVVAGKFAGSLARVVAPFALALALPLALAADAPVDVPALVGGALGLLLAASAVTAVGLLASSLTSSQALAALLAFTAFVLSVALGILGDALETNLGSVLADLSLLRAFEPFATGVLDAGGAARLLAGTLAPLLLAHRALEARRWA